MEGAGRRAVEAKEKQAIGTRSCNFIGFNLEQLDSSWGPVSLYQFVVFQYQTKNAVLKYPV